MATPWRRSVALGSAVAWLALAGAASGVEIDWVVIDDPGNPADPEEVRCCVDAWEGMSDFGSVDAVYRIGRTEIAVAQYAEFLNATADSDPRGLYNPSMATIGISRTGASGSYQYAVGPGCAQRPVAYTDFFDTLRFANWLHNGQLADASTTEFGAYPLMGTNPADVEREPGAAVFLPSEDEWYKAAYWDPELQVWWDYPTGSDLAPTPGGPPGGENSGNFCHDRMQCAAVVQQGCPTGLLADPSVAHTTDVGSYLLSPSPAGTFDQGGNLTEWTESRVLGTSPVAIGRGGWYVPEAVELKADLVVGPPLGCQGCPGMGFRVAALPEPEARLAQLLGLGAVIALARARRKRGARG